MSFLSLNIQARKITVIGRIMGNHDKTVTGRQKSLTLVRKPSPERVMKSCLKCLKLEASERVKKPLLSLPSNAQLVSNL